MFATKPCPGFTRHIVWADLQDEEKLDRWDQGAQGYAAESYIGQLAAIERCFTSGPAEQDATHGGGVALPFVKNKALNPRVWDAPNVLLQSGGHMPLLFYIGDRSNRSPHALAQREGSATDRGWGINSANRVHHMEGA